MGYYVSGEGELVIKQENLTAAYEAMMALQERPAEWKRGGGQGKAWYSWMPEDLRTIPNAAEVFRALGFEVGESDEGIVIGRYDSKNGQEDVFIAAAAPFIEDGEYEWTGEDAEFWRWEFIGGKMYCREGKRMWSEGHEVRVDDLIKEQVEIVNHWKGVFAK
jgi:hypothetical protein